MLVQPLIVISLDCFVLEKSIPGTLTNKFWAQKQGTCSLTYEEKYYVTLSSFLLLLLLLLLSSLLFFFFFFLFFVVFFFGGGG